MQRRSFLKLIASAVVAKSLLDNVAVKAIEAIIQKSRSAPVAADDLDPAPSVTAAEVKEMQFALDEHGNRKINTDPEFKKEFKRKQALLFGDAPYRQTVG